MTSPAHCKLCGEPHWSYEPHKFPKDLKVRKMVQQFTGKVIEGKGRIVEAAVVKARKPVTIPVTEEPPETLNIVSAVATQEKPVTSPVLVCAAPDCSNQLTLPKRGPRPVYCSAVCRVRASRRK